MYATEISNLTAEISRATLFREVMLARARVYRLTCATPTQEIRDPSGGSFLLKREDLSPIHSYKWRGAFNKLSVLAEQGESRHIVAASAGNHAQGVAIAASKLNLRATIFMPTSTPHLKVSEVQRFAGGCVKIVQHGDTFDEAAAAASEFCTRTDAVIIPPFDDLHVIAGQGTIGDEIVSSATRPRVVYLQIGGGGLAAGVACVLKTFDPTIRVIGVEGDRQASMAAAVRAGMPIALQEIDRFCDGTAVRIAGSVTFPLCADLIDEFQTVTNDEVCAAMQILWEAKRLVPEPSGAMGVAALLRDRAEGKYRDDNPLAILSGANMDFATLSRIPHHAGVGCMRRRYYEFEIAERNGSLFGLLERIGTAVNIIDFQYGKTDHDVALPVIGFEGTPEQLSAMEREFRKMPVPFDEVSARPATDFRVIPLRPDLCASPYFAVLDFPERAGALRDFMRTVSDVTNICYFNYQTTGETEGHAMMGFEFDAPADRSAFLDRLANSNLRQRELSLRDLRMDHSAHGGESQESHKRAK
ncbi:MAG: pyridoxal-phosphate dependent enzyme [Anaerolineae bacterium]|nr:pyridoxal-phosphate dependent enzyme [Phycisphaerae bacterium]